MRTKGIGDYPNKRQKRQSVYTLALLATIVQRPRGFACKSHCGALCALLARCKISDVYVLAIRLYPILQAAISQIEIGGNRRLDYTKARAERLVKAAKRGEADALTSFSVRATRDYDMIGWIKDKERDYMKDKDDDILELTLEEIAEIENEDDFDKADDDDGVSEFYFANPDPYAKAEPRPDDAPKHDVKFDEHGNIIVKNPSAFWLPDLTIREKDAGTEYTVTGSYDGTETLDKKLSRIMEQNLSENTENADDKS